MVKMTWSATHIAVRSRYDRALTSAVEDGGVAGGGVFGGGFTGATCGACPDEAGPRAGEVGAGAVCGAPSATVRSSTAGDIIRSSFWQRVTAPARPRSRRSARTRDPSAP